MNRGASIAEANVTANDGITCTNAMVFRVAMFVDCELIPIHMPNHISAQAFATNVRTPHPWTAAKTQGLGEANPRAMVTPALDMVVLATVTFVPAAFVPSAGGGGDIRAALIDCCARCAIKPPHD